MTKTIQQIQNEIQTFSPHPNRVKLLAVSKKQPISKISELVAQTQTCFGENYVQEALGKIDLLPKNLEWHLIGHLQSKKVNSIIGKFAYIHSVDSIKITSLIGEKSKAAGIIQKIFLEVNLGQEESKTGFSPKEIHSEWTQISGVEGVQICGLMALPPASEDEQTTRNYFRQLCRLLLTLRQQTNTNIHPMEGLSMGTSQDYHLALEEGATVIRVGTILFGERN